MLQLLTASPRRRPPSLPIPGRSLTLLVHHANGTVSERRMGLAAPVAAGAYFRCLLTPVASLMLQALARGWLVRRRASASSERV